MKQMSQNDRKLSPSPSPPKRIINLEMAKAMIRMTQIETEKLVANQKPKKHTDECLIVNHTQNHYPQPKQMNRDHFDQTEEISMSLIEPSSYLSHNLEPKQEYELELTKESKSRNTLTREMNKKIKRSDTKASHVVRGLQTLAKFTIKNYEYLNGDYFFEKVNKIAKKNIYLDTRKKYGSDSIVACKDENSYLVVHGTSGFVVVHQSVKVAENNFQDNELEKVLNAVYVNGNQGFGVYYFSTQRFLYFVSVFNAGVHSQGTALGFEHPIDIAQEAQWFGCLRYNEETQSLFFLAANRYGSLDIQVVQIDSCDQSVPKHSTHTRIVDREPSRGFKWFDFIDGHRSKIFAVTQDHCSTVIDYDHQSKTSRFPSFQMIPQIGHFGQMIKKAGPYCMSSNGQFFLVRANTQMDALYRLKISYDQNSGYVHSLKYLAIFNTAGSIIHERVVYSDFACSNNRAQFLVVDGPVCRILTWCQWYESIEESGRNEFVVEENSLHVKDGNYSNLCRVGRSNLYLVSDYLGRVGKIRVKNKQRREQNLLSELRG